ncbi:putative membrane protein YkvI [Virgibacillus natechei]|uniref:Membrane protein YkvI n=1 Tax=Virgibacillus natechei TaxID=1216297 RepID=A0ABS4IJG3_9BACI|nr:hypothetical protein [Virgibacillus natechei]MBP1971098.1 putative membrane protein YkvI [Virgibacillus natechei]
MRKVLQIGSAFIGIIVGAGFASGQEILQYFTSFGYIGILGGIVATALFAYIGMILAKLGSRLQATSHRGAIYKISGRFLGTIIDYIIIFTLFGVGVVMLAGGGSILNQQFGLPAFVGSMIMTILVLLTVMLNVSRVVKVIGSITPFLILAVIILSIYNLVTVDASFASLDSVAREHPSATPNWFLSAINYVSFNIAVGVSMTLVMGGNEKNEKTAAWGGLIGGLGIGILILISHLTIFSQVDVAGTYEMPMLSIADSLLPGTGLLYSLFYLV